MQYYTVALLILIFYSIDISSIQTCICFSKSLIFSSTIFLNLLAIFCLKKQKLKNKNEKQEMLHILAIAVRQVIIACIHNLKWLAWLQSYDNYYKIAARVPKFWRR